MPTGYTAGILDGKITTFHQFAKQCMRAFGATIHMRDEDMDCEFVPRTPSNYHSEQLEKAKQLLKDSETLSDAEIVSNRKLELEKSKEYHLNSIEKAKSNTIKMNSMLTDIRKWSPPTSEHNGLKEFMIDQIQKTIDFDCGTSYHDKELLKINLELKQLDSNIIRNEMIARAKKDMEYHITELAKDIDRCNQSNKWVEVLLKSIN